MTPDGTMFSHFSSSTLSPVHTYYSTSLPRTIFLCVFPVTLLVLSGCISMRDASLTPPPPKPPVVSQVRDGADIVTRVDAVDEDGEFTGKTEWFYPNGHRSFKPQMDRDWRNKTPEPGETVDDVKASGQPGSSGHTSGSIIRTF